MKEWLERLKEKFDALTSREKWLIAFAGWFVIAGSGALVFIEPMTKAVSDLQRQFTSNAQNTKQILTLNALKQQKLSASPNAELEARLSSLNADIAALDDKVQAKVAGLVPAPQMSRLVEKVLSQSARLNLVSMTSLSAKQITESKDAGYFVHPVELTLTGRYFDIVKYLSDLEALPEKYYWRSVDYRVTEYPLAEVVIQVYTLGESEIFIGGSDEGRL
ncbi:type II secretion system protein GspM [Enterovibrio nigricans]|uniref:MSHA biogenesis protein MshJ n=1 Tax=Enterovibrio nigricans DSM 22720 TaxID=1121868 RepID=A0A1T4TWG8_9GAMM|nr:type II secretion system protein GspM [Enterovibrio nigricans]PKF50809.1 MSHA biogenesis protein MshJ [Enterovibrio nigricans]SKA44579.1 MSHA biogenesis protein MshJ [Enterovibrio nigricans DSM 22720]